MTNLQTPQTQRFVRHIGIAAPFHLRHNVDTDVIAPLSPNPNMTGLSAGERAFEPIRYLSNGSENPDFVLNQEAYRNASILIAGNNFGTGSSRGSGVSYPMAFGIRVVIAPSFGPIFYLNAAQRGMLAITLDGEVVARLGDWAVSNPGVEMMVDLERNVIEVPGLATISFSIDARIRDKLLLGATDELDEMLQHSEGARELRNEDRNTRPWIYTNGTGANR